MRKQFGIFGVLLTLGISLQAQQYRLGISFSPTLQFSGIDNSDFGTDNLKVDSKSNIGFSYGLNVDYFDKEGANYAIVTGFQVNHSFRSYSYNYSEAAILGGNFNYEKKYTTTFVNLPIGFKMLTNEIGYSKFFAHFGANLPFRVRSREDFTSNAVEYKNEESKDVKFMNPSLSIGGGMEYNLFASTSALVGIYYNNGFFNMVEDNDDERIVFRGVELRLGIMF